MRSFGVAVIASLGVFGLVPGQVGAEAGAAKAVSARAAQSVSVGDLRVQRRASGGRVRGSVAATAGAPIEVVLRRGGRRVGSARLTASGSGTTRFSVRLNRANRARLRRNGSLRVNVDVKATAPGSEVSTAQDVRVTS